MTPEVEQIDPANRSTKTPRGRRRSAHRSTAGPGRRWSSTMRIASTRRPRNCSPPSLGESRIGHGSSSRCDGEIMRRSSIRLNHAVTVDVGPLSGDEVRAIAEASDRTRRPPRHRRRRRSRRSRGDEPAVPARVRAPGSTVRAATPDSIEFAGHRPHRHAARPTDRSCCEGGRARIGDRPRPSSPRPWRTRRSET